MARLLDAAGVDGLLVGDSLGMVVQGHENPWRVTLDEMIYHTRLVARGIRRSLLIADMPFMSFQVSPQQALENAGRLIKEGGAHAVKLEGGEAQRRGGRRDHRRRYSGDGPRRPDAAIGPPLRRLPRAARRDRLLEDAWPSKRPAPSRWCWNACRPSWPGEDHGGGARFRLSASAPGPGATGRCW